MAQATIYRLSRPEEMDLAPTALGRSHSVQSDRPSFSSSISLISPPLSISPEPAYIAAAVASQIVNDNCESQMLEDFEENQIEPSGETALVAPGALKLVNAFLDQLLYNFLSAARSISLSPLRLAVSDVLKPKLAREAVAGADQELSEYLGEEGLSAFDNAYDTGGDWDLEHAFKRSRLRCMVFCRLGEMEEDEGTEYSKEQQLDGPSTMYPYVTEVSPAVAIFLASVLEFIGEQSLVTGGQAAYKRLRMSKSLTGPHNYTPSPNTIMDRVVVEELDMEKVALNSVLGRLWRTWRSRVRSPRQSRSRPLSPGAYQQYQQPSRSTSATPSAGSIKADNQLQEREMSYPPSVAEILNDSLAASITLPMNENDVEEIEVPGLAMLNELQHGIPDAATPQDRRPKSMSLSAPRVEASPSLTSSMSHAPRSFGQSETEPTVPRSRKRSQSLPTTQSTPFIGSLASVSDDSDPEIASLGEQQCGQTLTQQVGEQVEEHKGLVASVIAGATAIGLFGTAAIGSAAIAGVAAAAVGEAPDTKIQSSRPSSQFVTGERRELEEAQIFESTRVSVEEVRGPTPVEIGRSRSRTTSSSKSSTTPNQPRARTTEVETSSSVAEGNGVENDPTAIGVARTSNIPVAAMVVSPSRESFQDEGLNADESAWKEKRSSRFVLAAPPTSRSQRSSATLTPPAEVVASNPSTLPPSLDYRPSALESGTLPLAPLREIRENGVYASDRGILPAESHSTYTPAYRLGSESPITGHPPRVDSTSFSPSSHTPISVNHSKPQQQTPLTQKRSSAENASVPEVTNSSVASYSPLTPKHGRSISLKRDKDDKESIRTRSSNDGNRSTVAQRDQKQQNFERLIQGDQTIQYTLTPQNMRKIEAPRTQTADLAEFLKNSTPPVELKARPSTSRSIKELNRNNGLRSNPIQENPHTPASPRSPRHRPLVTPVRSKSDGPTARQPTYERETTKDFADFIRSTGPENTSRENAGRPTSAKRLQARGAQVSASNSSELADFFREGPPPGRDVTPKLLSLPDKTKNTINTNNTGNRLISPSSYQGSSMQSKSERSSSNSHTGLLENKSKMEACQAGISNKAQDKLGLTEPAPPQRKQRRVKDPYAIDTDSDEDHEPKPTTKAKRGEESLIDFLNNVTPPQSAVNKPALADSQAAEVLTGTKGPNEVQKAQGVPKAGPRTLQKKQSGHGIGSRFGRGSASPEAVVDSNGTKAAKSTLDSVPKRSSSGAPQLSLNRTGSGTLFSDQDNLVSVNGASNPSTFNATPPITSSSPGQVWKENKARGLAPPVAVGPQLGARRTTSGRSNDLIDFLNAGPPPGVTSPTSPPTSPPATIKEETGFRQMFGRMKKNKKAVA
ncbi:MAG: hypothetical protein M1812_003726 [Candelaria pacifica]|nr:MAG: hypothetical protein M1812_003726 [Candelaria pacifica]